MFCHLGSYRDADKSLARPRRKQARKNVRDARDFNNIETRAAIKFFFSARQGAEGNSRHSDINISLFPSWPGLRTYQHPCKFVIFTKCISLLLHSLLENQLFYLVSFTFFQSSFQLSFPSLFSKPYILFCFYIFSFNLI